MLIALTHYLRMIKFSHTLFALPFALAAVLIIYVRYRENTHLTLLKVGLIAIAFTAMRSFAMAINRLADRNIDAQNQRTANREIPAGKLNVRAVAIFAALSLLLLCVSAYALTPVAGYLALPVAGIVAGYSFAKRFTALCHFWLGAAIGLAPVAVYVALLQQIKPEALFMAISLCFYIAGFDILYALQDREFDRKQALHSIPVSLGVSSAMWISRSTHIIALISIGYLIYLLELSPISWVFFSVLTGLLVTEHVLVGSANNPRYEKIPIAFFHVNSVFSIAFLMTIGTGLLTKR